MKKICLATGSTSGIGLATAKKLCQNNIVIINARKLPPKNFIMQNFKKPENVQIKFYHGADINCRWWLHIKIK